MSFAIMRGLSVTVRSSLQDTRLKVRGQVPYSVVFKSFSSLNRSSNLTWKGRVSSIEINETKYWLNESYREQLWKDLCVAARSDNKDTLKVILDCARFPEISENELCEAFLQATLPNKKEILESIRYATRYSDNFYLILGCLMVQEANRGISEWVRCEDGFSWVSKEDLQAVFSAVMSFGDKEAMEKIIKSDRFFELSAELLGRALCNLVEDDKEELVRRVIDSGRFEEISYSKWWAAVATGISNGSFASSFILIKKALYGVSEI
ncbi:MAG: hypothetical protein V4489_05265 [Chlamydiota bacterium]